MIYSRGYRLTTVGFLELDILHYLPQSPYFLGGGGLSTSLWLAITSHLVSFYTCCGKLPMHVINSRLKPFQNNLLIACMDRSIKGRKTTIVDIYKTKEEHTWRLRDIGSWQHLDCSSYIKTVVNNNKNVALYVKLPMDIINSIFHRAIDKRSATTAINPTGKYTIASIEDSPADIVFLNKQELINATKRSFIESLQRVERLEKNFIVTLGSKGVLCYLCSDKSWYYTPAINCGSVKDSLGCGDAFVAGFLPKFIEGNVEEGLLMGVLLGSLSTQIYGALPPPSFRKVLDKVVRDIRINNFRRYIIKTDSAKKMVKEAECALCQPEFDVSKILKMGGVNDTWYWRV